MNTQTTKCSLVDLRSPFLHKLAMLLNGKGTEIFLAIIIFPTNNVITLGKGPNKLIDLLVPYFEI
jgi:hypothetical protein